MTKEDLKKYDFILLIDKSGSMGTRDCVGGKTRWEMAREETVAIAQKCMEFDSNGITVIPFAGKFKIYENITGGDAKTTQIFDENEPGGSTDTASVLKYVLEGYTSNPVKPIIVICVTDGTPDNKEAVADVIVSATKKIKSEDEIGILFIQIGKDPGAREFLKYLDEGLEAKGAKFDIVNSKDMDEMEDTTISQALMDALLN